MLVSSSAAPKIRAEEPCAIYSWKTFLRLTNAWYLWHLWLCCGGTALRSRRPSSKIAHSGSARVSYHRIHRIKCSIGRICSRSRCNLSTSREKYANWLEIVRSWHSGHSTKIWFLSTNNVINTVMDVFQARKHEHLDDWQRWSMHNHYCHHTHSLKLCALWKCAENKTETNPSKTYTTTPLHRHEKMNRQVCLGEGEEDDFLWKCFFICSAWRHVFAHASDVSAF